MTIEMKHEILVYTIAGRIKGHEDFLSGLEESDNKYQTVKDVRAKLEELKSLLKVVNNLEN